MNASLKKYKNTIISFALFFSFGIINVNAQSEFATKCLERYQRILTQIENKGNFENENARAEAFFQAFANNWKNTNPTWARSLGYKGYDGLWWDNSLAIQKMHIEVEKKALALVRSFEKGDLSKNHFLNLSLVGLEIRNNLITHEQHLLLLPVENQWGIHSVIASELGDVVIKNPTDLEHYLGLLEGADQLLYNAIELMRAGMELGVVQPKVSVNKVLNQLEQIIATPTTESPFFQALNELPNSFTKEEKTAAETKAQSLIEGKIMPTYQKFKTYFEENYEPNCRESIGCNALPNGESIYRFYMNYHTTTTMSAQEIHEKGKQEVERIKEEMRTIVEEVGFNGDFDKFNEYLKTDPQFYYKSEEDLLNGYKAICKRIDPKLSEFFEQLPKTPYDVKAVPDYLEKAATAAYYSQGSLSDGVPGYFYANTYALESRPMWEMEALTLHEAIPGHHLQISLANEMEGMYEFRKFLHYTAYVEGWALYAESLGEEMGLYENPYAKYGKLTFEIWRAIRLVVDTGIHAFGWTQEEAVNYFLENSPRSKHDVEVEVNRYITWPGQALGYKIGELKITELRNFAENELGDNFDLRAFHSVILSQGAVPLNVLEQMVKEYVAVNK